MKCEFLGKAPLAAQLWSKENAWEGNKDERGHCSVTKDYLINLKSKVDVYRLRQNFKKLGVHCCKGNIAVSSFGKFSNKRLNVLFFTAAYALLKFDFFFCIANVWHNQYIEQSYITNSTFLAYRCLKQIFKHMHMCIQSRNIYLISSNACAWINKLLVQLSK